MAPPNTWQLKYCPEMLVKMKEYYAKCNWRGNDHDMLLYIDLSEKQAYEYEDKYPDFLRLREVGRESCKQKFLQYGYDNVNTPTFNHSIYNFLGRCIHNLPNERLLKSRLLRDAKTVKKQGEAIMYETATARFTAKEAQTLSSAVANLANAVKTSELEDRVDALASALEKLQED